jgi:hypothetical protein
MIFLFYERKIEMKSTDENIEGKKTQAKKFVKAKGSNYSKRR